MAVKIFDTRVHNPNRSLRRSKTTKRSKSTGRGKKRSSGKSSNPALVLMGPMNPNKGVNMTKRKKKSSRNPRGSATKRNVRRKRRNPSMTHRSRRTRRNPAKIISRTGDIFQLGFWVVVGLVLTRQLPQMLLGAKNTGVMGYLANIGTAIASAWAAGSIGGEKAALGAGAGGGAYVITRVAQEQINPIGKYLSLQGLGDAMALGEILTGDRTYFPLPLAYDNNRNPIIPAQIRAVPPALPAAMPPASLGMMRRRAAM